MAALSIAVVGLGFGQAFVPIYARHPDVARVVLVEPDAARLAEVGDRFAIDERDRRTSLTEVLADDGIDAVHILAPVRFHADLAVDVLRAGKHCACAVPMATSLTDLERVIAAQEQSGTRYMMMETSVFGREYLAVRDLHRRGEFGPLTLYRGYHIQNLDGFPAYWQGFPPMRYITHALSPILALLDTAVDSVQARGAGTLTGDRRSGGFDNPFPAEAGLFQLAGSDVLADVTMSFFQTARSYIEGFSLYGERLGVEWPPSNEGDMTAYRMSRPTDGSRGNVVDVAPLTPDDYGHLLPDEIAGFTRESRVELPGMHVPATLRADHGGSHPHLVHEFVSSIVESRRPLVDARTSARWTAAGICAHESALAGGAAVRVPAF